MFYKTLYIKVVLRFYTESMAQLSIQLSSRDSFGKGSAKKLRKEGYVPCVISSSKGDVVHASLKANVISKLVESPNFFSNVLEATVEGGKKPIKVLPIKVDFHPVSGSALHVDFVEVSGSKVEVKVPVSVVGTDKAPGLKKGGKLNFVRYHVPLFCKVDSIPTKVEVNISSFGIGRSIFLSNVSLPTGCEMVHDCLILSIIGRGRKEKAEEEQVAAASAAASSASSTSTSAKATATK